MFPPAMTLPSMDYWSGEQSPFSSASSPDEIQKEFTRPSGQRESCGGSCSPPGLHSPTETNPFKFDSFLSQQQTFPIRRASVPYSRQQVNHIPSMGVNSAWPTLSQQNSAFSNACQPRAYVFEAPRCCTTPRIRVIHECCNKESNAREVLHEPQYQRRNYPTASKLTLCRFCLKNGEPPSVYYAHNLHTEDGRVSCPVLRRYDCPICNNGGGDYAHTVRYCPFVRSGIMR